jgi:pimeloyl-ACP methyl ester carboxylesterase
MAEQQITQAKSFERADPKKAVGLYLGAVESATVELRRKTRDELAARDYNFALSRAFSVIREARLDPWTAPLRVPASQTSEYVLSARPFPYRPWKPKNFDFIPADELDVRGRLIVSRVTRAGIGAPLVAVQKTEIAAVRQPFLLPRIYGAATAVAHFTARRCEIEFLVPTASETVTIAGRTLPASADFTAPLAFGLSREHPEKSGAAAMLNPERFADRARLIQIQPYNPEKIPVVFVHGLQATPVTWAPMITALWADPVLRRKYQAWVFNYPSGYPVPYSALLLRRQLGVLDKAMPRHRRIVLVGHSMGGILSRLMISDSGGDKIWRYFFGRSPAQTQMSAHVRATLTEALIFKPRSDVARVIFISTPHRGSEIAQGPIGRLAAGMIHNSAEAVKLGPEVLQASIVQDDPGVMKLKRMPNSIDTLAPNDPFVKIVNTLPLAKGVPYHSIIGDRGRGDTPNSSDGVVPYWSSHIGGAKSEKIVPSGHGANQNPEAITEVIRILKEHTKNQRLSDNNAADDFQPTKLNVVVLR